MIIGLMTFVYFLPISGLTLGSFSDPLRSIRILRNEKTLAVIRTNDDASIKFCSLYDLEKHTHAVEASITTFERPVLSTSFDQMMKIIKECQEIAELNEAYETGPKNMINSTQLKSVWRGIVPGTKWCGLGDEAQDYHDLGSEAAVDICCRAHDHCPMRLKAFRSDYGSINLSLYTRSHCRCDKEFYDCLKLSRSPLADIIGNLYFNILKVGCLEHHRVSKCLYNSRECPRLFKRQVHQIQFAPNRLMY